MQIQRTGSYDLKFLILPLFAGVLFYSCYLKTSSSSIYVNESEFDANIQAAGDFSPVKLLFPAAFSKQPYQARDTGIAEGHALINSSDCYTCHAEYKILLAPSFSEIATRYKNDKAAIQKLAIKVISGSIGTWGDRSMPAHPEFLQEDAQKMIQYIMNLNKKKDSTKQPVMASLSTR